MRAIVVGGTGPTGPHIVEGLLERGYEVAVFHRGTHEVAELPDVEHIHADPHFKESVQAAIEGRQFDLVISTYGRIRRQAEAFAGRCERFIGIGGVTVYLGNAEPSRARPFGMRLMSTEQDPLAIGFAKEATPASTFVQAMADTERSVLALHEQGAFSATWFRYPIIYGPRNIIPWEWSVIRRVKDRRPFIIVPDGGLSIRTRASGRNAAHAVLLAVDQPTVAAGQIYNVGDDYQLMLRQWMELLNELCGGDMEIVSLPWSLAMPAHIFFPFRGTGSPHVVVDTTKIKTHLGYADAISPRDALIESIEWYGRNPVTSEKYPNFPDLFDYAREDQLVNQFREAVDQISADVDWPEGAVIHNYAHPKTADQLRDHRGR